MPKPLLILDQHFRSVEELFSPQSLASLGDLCRIEGGENHPMDAARIDALLPEAQFLVAARPGLNREQIKRAGNLKAVIEVSGAFHGELEYSACFDHGLEVLSCAPGFRYAVAEMGLAMILAGARGLVSEHEAFRRGSESWLDDREGRDFTLFGQSVGFVGYGNIARELHRLLVPFDPVVSAYDPWLKTFPDGVTPADLEAVFAGNRVVVVTAVPSETNKSMIGSDLISLMPEGALLVVLSRAHVLDFKAAIEAANSGRITFATDVYPSEPVDQTDPIRKADNVIFSPHRAAAVERGRQPIGDMIVHDIQAILAGDPDRHLLRADPARVAEMVAAQESIDKAGRLSNT